VGAANSGATGEERCACGNPASERCEACRASVCRLCVREDERKRRLCLACRSFAIEREEEQRRRAGGNSGRFARAASGRTRRRVRRDLVILPAVTVGALAAMSAIAISFMGDARGVHAERRAEDALRMVVEAEQRYQRQTTKGYTTLEDLEQRRMLGLTEAPGYEIRLELARDGHTFWVRAVPVQTGLRGLTMDAKGEVAYEDRN